MILGAPHRSGARRGPPAFTEYDIRPRWVPVRDGQACGVASVEMEVSIVIRLPIGVSSGVERWLRRHENGHRRLVEEASEALLSRLEAARAPSCPGLAGRVDRIVRDASRELEAAHARYDGIGETPLPEGLRRF